MYSEYSVCMARVVVTSSYIRIDINVLIHMVTYVYTTWMNWHCIFPSLGLRFVRRSPASPQEPVPASRRTRARSGNVLAVKLRHAITERTGCSAEQG